MRKKCPYPMCLFDYNRRNCPEICPRCHVLLATTSSGKKNVKPPKILKPANPKHVTVHLGDGVYSVQYHQHNRSVTYL